MVLQTENRNHAEVGSAADKVDYQRFEHSQLDVLQFTPGGSVAVSNGQTYPVSVRIYCPEVRVISRVACIFMPLDPNSKANYKLTDFPSDIVAYRCMNAKSRVARVGEIVGKNGVPLQFPKSDIDGIAFQIDDDMPWIDIDMNLSFPGVAGTWAVFYHATSNNKLKKSEWEGYISRVTMSVQLSPGLVTYAVES